MSSHQSRIQPPQPAPDALQATMTIEATLPYASDRRHRQDKGPPWMTEDGFVITERRSHHDRRGDWH